MYVYRSAYRKPCLSLASCCFCLFADEFHHWCVLSTSTPRRWHWPPDGSSCQNISCQGQGLLGCLRHVSWTVCQPTVSAALSYPSIDYLKYFCFQCHFLAFFTALHAMPTRSSDEKAVCPSVCLSVCQTRGLWQNGRKICPDFYTIRKII